MSREANTSLIIFSLDAQQYAIPVDYVVKIIDMVTIIRLPGISGAVQGIINVSGKAVPVLDLRVQFGLTAKPYGLHTPIILINPVSGGILGLIVDQVEQVTAVAGDALEMMDKFMPAELMTELAVHTGHLVGIAHIENQIIAVLNVNTLLSRGDQLKLAEVVENINLKKDTHQQE